MSIPLAMLMLSASVGLAQTTRPALTQISREMQSLYDELETHLVRVQIPIPTTQQVSQNDHPMNKWAPQLEKLRQRMESGDSIRIYVEPNPATRSTTQASTQPTTQSLTLRIEQLADSQKLIAVNPAMPTSVECVGVILDDEGHIMMPSFVDRGDRQMNVLFDNGRRKASAKFVGSDRQTNTTVIQLEQPIGRGIELSETRPEVGSLVLMVYPSRGNIRMEVWTGGRDEYAIVVGMDGRMSGVLQRGHLLSPGALRPVLAQLIDTGTVERAKVGIAVLEVPLDSPTSTAAGRTAVRVTEVRENSPAHLAGIQTGDLIVSLAGQPVEDLPNFAAAITTCRGKTELRVLRNGAELKALLDLKPN
jgi:S1-C subfamily serine protease